MTACSNADDFWRDPPWRGGKTQFRMGLAEIEAQCWLPDPIPPGERARKRALLTERREAVLASVRGFERLEALVVGAIAAELDCRGGYLVDDHATRLADAALWVPDDLCLLSPGSGGYRLVSACLCSPSYWRLNEKIGKPVQGVHGPVRGLNEAIGSYIHRFLDNLPEGRVFQRRNWLIHQSDEPFHPEDEHSEEALEPGGCPNLFVRSETQTLRRFPSTGVLFTIRVRSYPLGEIAAFPHAAADLLTAMEHMSADERRAFGYAHRGPALHAFLGGVAAGRGVR